MKWVIDKQFDFCYGHRVWNQSLDANYSLDSCLACRHLHGHQGKIKIFLETDRLQSGMVTDFKHLNWFKVWLDDTLDHKFIIDKNDPLFSDLLAHYAKEGRADESKLRFFEEGFYLPDLNCIQNESQALHEKYEGMVIVNFVPTSENISAWLLSIVQKRMAPLGVKVCSVEFWETPKSHCKVSL
jgi:6-pyruvoyltetrahydropterin/6-carboxytetrahydropterin synthase